MKVVVEVELEGGALIEASEKLLKMAQGFDSRLASPVETNVKGEPAPVALMPPPGTEEATPPPPGAELDEDGRPWDIRIDSSGKSKTKDGRWTLKRKVDLALVAQVKAEYIVAPAETTAAAATPPPPAAPVVVEPCPLGAPEGFEMTEKADDVRYESYIEEGWTEAQLLKTGKMQARSVVAEVPTAPVTFKMITAKVTARVDAGKLQVGELEEVLADYAAQGVTDLPSLASHPELWAAFHGKLVEAWR